MGFGLWVLLLSFLNKKVTRAVLTHASWQPGWFSIRGRAVANHCRRGPCVETFKQSRVNGMTMLCCWNAAYLGSSSKKWLDELLVFAFLKDCHIVCGDADHDFSFPESCAQSLACRHVGCDLRGISWRACVAWVQLAPSWSFRSFRVPQIVDVRCRVSDLLRARGEFWLCWMLTRGHCWFLLFRNRHFWDAFFEAALSFSPPPEVTNVGDFKVGVVHGHQIVPWGLRLRRNVVGSRRVRVEVMPTPW